MRDSLAVAVVSFCLRRRWAVIGAAAVLTLAAVLYTLGNLTINTNVDKLFSANTPWIKAQSAYRRQFPAHQIIAALSAPTPELAEIASTQLTAALQQRPDVIAAAEDPQVGAFAERSALLFTPAPQLAAVLAGIEQSAPALKLLAADPSLRGAMQALSMGADAVAAGKLPAEGLDRPMTDLSALLAASLAHRAASISWRGPMGATPLAPQSTGPSRQFIEIDPKLQFNALQPGRAATEAIGQAAAHLQLQSRYQAGLQLTGEVPLDDAQFSTLSESAIPELLCTAAAVLAILFLALRSARLIIAVFLTIAVGLAATAAAGLLEVGAFNLISVAFAILFVGLGTDFAIQFSVRYRAERHETAEPFLALRRSAEKAGAPLALAAAGTMVGFFCFVPTSYRGVGELGEIAGTGMLIAFAVTMTLLPALLSVFGTPAEKRPMGFRFLAPVDGFLARHRYSVVIATILVVLAGTPLLLHIHFDFDPTHLQNQNSAAVKAYKELNGIPQLGVSAVNAVAPTVDRLNGLLQPLQRLSEVAGTRTVLDLIPPDQAQKLAQIRSVSARLLPDLNPGALQPPPSDAERITAIRGAVTALQRLKVPATAPTAAAIARLVPQLEALAAARPTLRDQVENALRLPLQHDLVRLRAMLQPQPVTLQSLPSAIKRDWLAADGAARIEILPKENPNDPQAMRRFAQAVLTVAPSAVGMPIELYEAQRSVVSAFIEAGGFAVVAIGAILWIALRRLTDVLLTLVPLIVAGLVTLELMALFGLPLNFANVIALPLLLGVGVAFKIYYIMAWRRGRTNLLQSTLTRAVFFSAMTTATAFGSLWASRNPGMSSMGQLMALALGCTLAAAVLFQPALMGPPRQTAERRFRLAPEAAEELEPLETPPRPRAEAHGSPGLRRVKQPEQVE